MKIMKIPIDGIQAFVEIADVGSFSRAAERLAITQTALTRRMQRLETFVGLRLLDRTTRSVSLTTIGRDFLPLARRLVDDLLFGLDNLRNASRFARGDVTVATLQSVAIEHLPHAIQRYAKLYPLNKVTIRERSGALVTEAVLQGQADFGIHVVQGPGSTLDEELLVHSPFVLICNRCNPLARRRSIRWANLDTANLITLGGASGNRRIVEDQLIKSGLASSGRFVVESTPSALAMVRIGLGVAILPTAIARFGNELVTIPLVDPVLYRSVGLVKRRNTSLTPAATALYEIVRQSFVELPAA
jgi:DNA-binding transcriptional LysR family regulator